MLAERLFGGTRGLAPRAAVVPSASVGATTTAQLTNRVLGQPATTPGTSTIHVAGDFNRWNARDARYALAPSDGGHAVTLFSSVRGARKVKLAVGAWVSVEMGADGGGVDDRGLTILATGARTLDVTVGGRENGVAAPKRSTVRNGVRVLADPFAFPPPGRTRRV